MNASPDWEFSKDVFPRGTIIPSGEPHPPSLAFSHREADEVVTDADYGPEEAEHCTQPSPGSRGVPLNQELSRLHPDSFTPPQLSHCLKPG